LEFEELLEHQKQYTVQTAVSKSSQNLEQVVVSGGSPFVVIRQGHTAQEALCCGMDRECQQSKDQEKVKNKFGL
jgi:siroheme synthase